MQAVKVTGPAKNLIRFCQIAREPDEDGVAANVSIGTFYRSEGSNGFIDAARAAGIDVHVIRERFRFDQRVVRDLADLLRQQAPDIVQTHGVKAHFLLRVSGLRRQNRWIAFHHGYTAEDLKMHLYNQLDRWSLPAADRVVTVCGAFTDALVSTGVNRNRIAVLPNSIEAGSFLSSTDPAALRQKLGIRDGERVILCIGRFSREKAMIDLVPAAAFLASVQPKLSFRLVLVGDGPERPRVEKAAASAGLADRILCVGHQRDVHPFYAMADVFVLPSHSEGSPNVVLEAMAAGVPIAATAVGGVPETVHHEQSALLVPAHDSKALAEAIARLLSNQNLAVRLAAEAALIAQQRFSPAAYRRSLLRIYSSLCREEKGA
jgi:glycosyltransferase involved in cell wall biosynthesis